MYKKHQNIFHNVVAEVFGKRSTASNDRGVGAWWEGWAGWAIAYLDLELSRNDGMETHIIVI